MRSLPQNNLTGKARRVHHRNRVARLSAQQQIDEAFQNDDVPAVVRLKPPVLHRPQREFIPSVDSSFDVVSGTGRETQMELPFGQPSTLGPTDNSETKRFAARLQQRCSDKRPSHPLRSGSDIPAGTQNHSAQFTLGGLLYGGLLGAAAAGLILLFVRAFI